MNYLLDTHTFIWTFLEPEKLPPTVERIITDMGNTIYLSATSLWEIAIKVQLKKLNLGLIDIFHLPNIAREYDFTIINPESYDYISYSQLPRKENHRDPFDRMLIHTAIRKNLVVLSCDEKFHQYKENGLQLLWE